MKYHSSFFTKYQIEPDIPVAELMVLFQTDPNKRKDLPILIKTISNQQALLEEELFTPHSGGDSFLTTHATTLHDIEQLNKNVANDTISKLRDDLLYLCENSDKWNLFFYTYGLPLEEVTSTIKEFLTCLYDEIKHILINTIGDVAIPFTTALYDCLGSLSGAVVWLSDKKDELDDDLCEFVDNSLSFCGTSSSFESKFGCLLSLALKNKHEYFKSSLRYIIDKMIDDVDSYGDILLNEYKLITVVFSGQDLLKISSFITKVGNKYCDITASKANCSPKEITDGCAKIAAVIGQLEDVGIQLRDVDDGKNKFSVDEVKTYTQIASFMSHAGSSWYDRYRCLFQDVKDNCTMASTYELVAHIMSAKPSAKLQNMFTNVILSESVFQPMLEFILKAHSDLMEKNTNKYLDPDDIDDFIGKYYWIIFTFEDTSLFNETFFNRIRMFSLDCLSETDNAISLCNSAKNSNNRDFQRTAADIARNGMTLALSKIPKDFFVEDNLRAEDAVKNFSGTHTGSVSKSSLYIDKYCDLFGKQRTKHGRQAYENRFSTNISRSTSSSSSSYSSSSSSSGCYVATAVYGSYDCPEVWTLRRFRDFELAETWYGRVFVHLYYTISPTIVKWFGKTSWFNKSWRGKLDRLVKKLQAQGYDSTPYEDRFW